MSVQNGLTGSFVGTGPYRITTPINDCDASGGLVEADANTNFVTNVPLGMGMQVFHVEWVTGMQAAPGISNSTQQNIWLLLGQITESLKRTSVTNTDNLDIDIYEREMAATWYEGTAGAFGLNLSSDKALERHSLPVPWLTVAQNLNVVTSIVPQETVTQPGPEFTMFCRIWYNLVQLTAAQQQYLAQRIQISGAS